MGARRPVRGRVTSRPMESALTQLGQMKQVGGEELDSRNIQEVAGGIRHFLDLGDKPRGEVVLSF